MPATQPDITPPARDSLTFPWWLRALRFFGLTLLAVLFLYAGIGKAMAPELFAIDIQNFELVGWEVATAIAYTLPWFEILMAVAILIPPTRLAGLWAMLCLLSGFTVVLLWSLISGLDIACGCLGAGDGDLPSSIVRNLVLIGITGGLIVTYPRLRRA